MVGAQTVYLRCTANQQNVVRQSNYALKAINGAGKRYYCLKRPKFSILTALGYTLYENWGSKGTGMVAPQTVVSMRCTTNQRNIVCQSNYALKAINGAGNDLIRLENKRKSGNADLTRLEKSDSSRDFFSCLDFVGDRGDFFEFFDFR